MTMNTSTWPREMFKNPIVSLASRAAPPYLIRESCRAKNFNVKLNHTKTAKNRAMPHRRRCSKDLWRRTTRDKASGRTRRAMMISPSTIRKAASRAAAT